MSEKRKFLVFRILIILLLSGIIAEAQKVNTVVLDAGHGGHDTGALGKHSREKDITLAIVLKLRDYIQENQKDVKVILTRDSDEFIELYRRAKIANENKADLFISIHCNSNPSPTPFGTETYVMGLHKSTANLAVAKAENAAILLEDDYVEQYDGFDPNSAEGNIFFSMMQNAFLDKSLDFAGKVERQFRDRLHFFDRGVKQAGFLVLYKTAMPGVLIETGFLSNARDEKLLLSDKGQDQLANAIFRSFREYKYTLEKRDLSGLDVADSTLYPKKRKNQLAEARVEKASVEPEMEVVREKVAKPVTGDPDDKVVYRIQFASSPVDKPIDSPEFRNLPDVWKYYQNGLYKFTTGSFETIKQASASRQNVVNKGFSDAFVVPFYRDKRITLEEARRLAGN
jgi:N-acetylmuramoyl-L-alanine amidase